MEGPFPFATVLAHFADEIRESSLKRFRSVGHADRNWSERADLLSFVDVLQHLVDADRWLFDWLDGRGSSSGVVISPGSANPAKWDALLSEFGRLGPERSRRIGELTQQDFLDRRFNLGTRGEVSLAQLILRCNLDHEIHHRGAMQLALRLRYC
jgi:uncharacterized damage-inducible protein DinB